MPPLAELQQQFARAIMTGTVPAMPFTGRVPPAEALAVHRGTIMAALVNALRLSYSTVDALVGAQFFDQTCTIFAQMNPPSTASLAGYGEGFADFLANFAPAAALAYLPDVARLDRAIEQTLHVPASPRCFVLDAAVSIALPRSLIVLRLLHPADEIRAALDDDAAMAAIDTNAGERFVLVWRRGFEACVQRLDAVAGRFLVSLLAGEGAEAAFAAASAGAPQADILPALQAGIFAAPFCTVISNSEEQLP